MPNRALVALLCSLSLIGCRNAPNDGALRVVIDYASFVPGCIEVTATEAEAGGDSSTVQLGPDALAGARSAVVAVFRKPEWIRSVDVRVRAFEGNCSGSAVEEVRSPGPINIDSSGAVGELRLALQAVDADGDRFAARTGSAQGTDCDDARAAVHPGAAEPCGNVDFDCDGVTGCAESACLGQTCDDGNPCTASDMCASGKCVGTVRTGSCDDGLACTTNDVCLGDGGCAGPPNCSSPPSTCYAPVGTCGANGCVYTPKSDGTSCDDGNSCTTSDACAGGTCVGTVNTGGNCTDGLVCTSTDRCLADGGCAGTPNCSSPPSQCYVAVGTCGASSCVYTPKSNGTSCDDQNLCTHSDSCASGTCSGVAYTCQANTGTPCLSLAGCTGDGGCQYQANPGTSCNDGLTCTFTDRCLADGGCAGTPNCSSPPNSACYLSAGTCGANGCVYTPKSNGTTCDDQDLCTHSDSCASGLCSGVPYTCSADAGTPCLSLVGTGCLADGGCQYQPNPGVACTRSGGGAGICGTDGTCGDPNGPFPYTPLNFTPAEVIPAGPVTVTCSLTYDTTNGSFTGCQVPTPPSETTITLADGRPAIVLASGDLNVTSTGEIIVRGDKPVIFAVYGNATIDGKVTVSSRVTTRGAGNNPSVCGTQTGGTGASSATTAGGGGGGGFATAGGSGGAGSSNAGTGGAGGTALTVSGAPPLRGGCAGGVGGLRLGQNGPASGGAGGGAIQISASGLLKLNGTISASAAGGAFATKDGAGGGGGGSGGVVLLEGYTVDITANAKITSNGAGGGAGRETTNGQRGADGSEESASPALGGPASNPTAGGSGGKGGAGTAPPTNGGDGTSTQSMGGGGGGGAVGVIYVRAGKTATGSCTRANGFVESPPADFTSCR
jgi:Putative metal-binding motif